MIRSPSNHPTTSNGCAPHLDHNKNEVIDTVDVQLIDSNEPAHNGMDKTIDITPLHRTFIGESHLPTPDQEIFVVELHFFEPKMRR